MIEGLKKWLLQHNKIIFPKTLSSCVYTKSGKSIDTLLSYDSDYHIYSSEEKVVGEWIDGNTLYERTILLSGLVMNNNVEQTINHGIENVDVIMLDYGRSYFLNTSNQPQPVNISWVSPTNSYEAVLFGTYRTFIRYRIGTATNINRLVTTIRYTKMNTSAEAMLLMDDDEITTFSMDEPMEININEQEDNITEQFVGQKEVL